MLLLSKLLARRNLSLPLLLIFVFLTFSPGLRAGFINWDDDTSLTNNPNIHDFSFSHFQKAFLFPQSGKSLYQPLTNLTYSLEYKFFGLQPFIYHLDNLLLHLFNVFLVFQLAYHWSSGSRQAAFLTAILFGLHPLRVESVVWVTERKDVLFSAFYLAGVLSYSLSNVVSSKKTRRTHRERAVNQVLRGIFPVFYP